MHRDRVTSSDTAPAGANIPEELIHDLLSRLPPKTIGRFRCVCKHWQTLLSDPQFLNLQFTRTNLQTKLIFPHKSSFISTDFLENVNHNNSGGYCNYPVVAVEENINFKNSNFCYTIRGSCNGLLLLIDYESGQLSIVNPITHESRKLPELPARSQAYRDYTVFGFGYCDCDADYSVVMVSDYSCISPVYMLKGKCWKRVRNSPVALDSDCGVFVNGAIHWLGFRNGDNSKVICAFDLAGERFRKVDRPGGLRDEDRFVLDVLGGCLCLVVKRRDRRTDLWVMKEYGVRKSWTKYLSYNLNFQGRTHFKPLLFWGGDEFVVGLDGRRVMLCSLTQKKTTMISVIGERFSEHFYRYAWTFAASLFSPNCSRAVE